jgi:hypothetical protein
MASDPRERSHLVFPMERLLQSCFGFASPSFAMTTDGEPLKGPWRPIGVSKR